jgi:kinesin family protein C2/C3
LLQVENRRLHDELVAVQDVEEKYKHVLEENRTLYNTVQDLRGNIRVFCRSVSTADSIHQD